MIFREKVSSALPEDVDFVNDTVSKMRKKAPRGMKGMSKPPCPIREGFCSFVRNAQYEMFNPDRPTKTCIFDVFCTGFELIVFSGLTTKDYHIRVRKLAHTLSQVVFGDIQEILVDNLESDGLVPYGLNGVLSGNQLALQRKRLKEKKGKTTTATIDGLKCLFAC